MRYTAKQLQLMAQVVIDAKENSTHKYKMFMLIMQQHTRMPEHAIEAEVRKYL